MTDLRTFGLPDSVRGTESDVGLGCVMVDAWRTDGVFQVYCNRWQSRRAQDAFEVSSRFFAMPRDLKERCVSDLTYSGHLDTNEGEVYLACPDIPLDDVRVQARWPGHGPVPWPGMEYRRTIRSYLSELGSIGENLLRLIALGLDLPEIDSLTALTEDGWHHLWLQRSTRKGPHIDYGMLVIAAHEEEPGILAVSPGDIMQFLTDGAVESTLHKAPSNDGERHTMTYFHEPAFNLGIRPLVESAEPGYIHYGSHFTNMAMQCWPDRITTRRIRDEDRLAVLAGLAKRASVGT